MRVRKALITTVVMATAVALLLTRSAAADPSTQAPNAVSGITLAGSVASTISYQGRLTDASGNPLNGNYNLVFQLWDDATGGNQVGGDIVRNNVPVSNGLFTVELDVPQEAFNGQALWLRVQVNGQWLAPRQELLPVPYALSLRPGAQIRGEISAAPAVLVTNGGLGGTAVQAHGDGVGLDAQGQTGVLAEGWAVGVEASGMTGVRGEGDVGVSGAGIVGVRGESESDGGAGVRGTATGLDGKGVEGTADFGTGVLGSGETGVKGTSAVGVGVRGEGATGVEGVGQAAAGVMGTSQATYGVTGEGPLGGVKGTSTSGDGVEGHSQSGSGVFGVSTSGDGVVGNSQTGVGVYGNTGSGTAAVMGEGPKGVYGRSSAESGEGVHGHGSGRLTEGVLGTATGVDAAGVYGIASATTGNPVGVWGQTGGTWGLYTEQNLYVGGSCTGCTVAFIAQNAGPETLEVGDVVSITGIAPPLRGQETPVLQVQRATAAANGVLGVVQARAVVNARKMLALSGDIVTTRTTEMASIVPGSVTPGDHLFVVVQGLAQVRADASAGAIQVGDPVGPIGATGLASRLSQDAPSALVVGRALEPLNKGTGLIWVLVLGR